jgi:hypothetical protein
MASFTRIPDGKVGMFTEKIDMNVIEDLNFI